jgi:lipoprotein-anchoring transpeptidase ErfK/SrfK
MLCNAGVMKLLALKFELAAFVLAFILSGFPQAVQAQPFSISGAMKVGGDDPSPTIEADKDVTPQITRNEISFSSDLPVGSILVKTKLRKLYFIEPGGMAIEYAVSVGREGFSWAGRNTITRMAEWPEWRAPPQMIAREAEHGHLIPSFVKGGPGNPLGARALYIGTTDYRIHGTDQPWTIGHATSSGCIRMMNQDVIELYGLAKVGTPVVVE